MAARAVLDVLVDVVYLVAHLHTHVVTLDVILEGDKTEAQEDDCEDEHNKNGQPDEFSF